MLFTSTILKLLFLSTLLNGNPGTQDVTKAEKSKSDGVTFPNLDSRTMGGGQFWTDELIYDNWRIQRNVVFGQHRLLDNKNVRRAWGSFEGCSEKLQKYKTEKKLSLKKQKVIVALHGLGRTRNSMKKLCQFLEKDGQFTTVNETYASTRQSIDKHAESLERIVANLTEAKEINFVAHSMGNIVIRRMLTNISKDKEKIALKEKVNRIVMLGPPNNGAQMAKRLEGSGLFEVVVGPAGKQLASNWKKLEEQLATPTNEFGIIAGGLGDERGRNFLIKGDDDMVVSVEEAKLPGATDFRIVPVLHSFIMDDPKVMKLTLSFFKNGYFTTADQRQPIEKK